MTAHPPDRLPTRPELDADPGPTTEETHMEPTKTADEYRQMIASNMAAARREEAIAAQFRARMIEVHGA